MYTQDKLLEEAKRILSIPSHAESGNEEVARHFQNLMQNLGFKTSTQSVQHSVAGLSKRQMNVVGFSSDTLVDRTTRRGLALVSPLDVTTGNLSHLWSSTQGNPYAPVHKSDRIIGAGANQGKLDFLCKILAATELLERRHKTPLYLIGTAASHFGMLGSKYLIESLAVNPAEVITFGPTKMKEANSSSGQINFEIELETPSLEKDSRGYNRQVSLQAYGLGVDLASHSDSINAFELIFDLLMEAAAQGFDYQWSKLEAKSAEGGVPDWANAQVYLTAFQFEDFKQFMRSKLSESDRSRFFRVEYQGMVEHAISFMPPTTIEVILELDYKWKELLNRFGLNLGVLGGISRISQVSNGKSLIRFELRFPHEFNQEAFETHWKTTVQDIFRKQTAFNYSLNKTRNIPAFSRKGEVFHTPYLADAGLFAKAKFETHVMGVGGIDQLPKGPNEFVLISQLEESIRMYREIILSKCV